MDIKIQVYLLNGIHTITNKNKDKGISIMNVNNQNPVNSGT